MLGRATNNVGEIQAAVRAIWDCSAEGLAMIRINTDSDYLRVSVEQRLWQWRSNRFCKITGEPLANQYDFINLRNALIRNSHMQIAFQHVLAHSGNPYNEMADCLAKEGAMHH